ncbi:PEP-CTERM sorting domain-containing protein [Stieleria sp. JC731]|uniref:PEP-CTERM sorting domain-containing protein n=1 Tax=Pirellulaceae TaxID=2691357 RepID=UPI001E4DB454|nr:PEP-CTERM sorting domain-containing protein [Stieleria sp. JC731]MCC9602647.1 PEP-CTERM sorting domain-containing protein [Stieleria sp. JC731]
MNLHKTTVMGVFFTILCGFSHNADAALMINFSVDDGASFGNSFTIEEGSVTKIGIFLSESGNTSILTDEGLLGFGLTGTLEAASPGTITSVTTNPVFDFNTGEAFTSQSITMESAIFTNPVPTGSSIFLGDFEFASTGAGESNFLFSDLTPGSGTANASWLSGIGTELDSQIFGTGSADNFGLTLNTTAVPEPGSFGLFLIGLPALLLNRRRR